MSVSELAADEVAEVDWYHTIELAPGVVTPGWFDTRPVVGSLPFPSSMAGMRCLDVGTYDGFWAFEMERRGAAEVVGIDVLDADQWDWPPNSSRDTVELFDRRKAAGRGFDIAKRYLDSSVTRHALSVYDATPETLGTFDFVYLGSLLVHLRDPVRALDRLRSVCTGQLLIVDGIDLFLTLVLRRRPAASLDARGRPWWWTPNVAGVVRMAEAAGFQLARPPRTIFMPPGDGQPLPPLHPRLLFSSEGRGVVVNHLKGDPHVVLNCVPA